MENNLDPGFVAWCEHKRLRTIFDGWKQGAGLFDNFTSTPWGNAVDSSLLDLDYFGVHSGYKRPTEFVLGLLEFDESDNIILPSQNRQRIAQVIENRYAAKWEKLWATYMQDFDPMLNFHLLQEYGGDNTDRHNGDDTITDSGQQSTITGHGKQVRNTGTDTATKTTTGSVSSGKSGTESLTQSGKEYLQQKGVESDTQTGKVTESNHDSDTTGIWGFGTSEAAADSSIVTKGTSTDTTIDVNNPLTVSHSYGSGNDARIDEKSFGTGQDARAETRSFNQRVDTITYGADSEHPLTETNSLTNGKVITESGTTTVTSKIGDDNGQNLLTHKTEYKSSMKHEYNSNIETSGYKDNPAKAIRDYIKVWQNDFFSIVYADIDTIIALQVY